jgi:hypothetical protein
MCYVMHLYDIIVITDDENISRVFKAQSLVRFEVFYSGDCEECRLVRCGAVQILYVPMFRSLQPPAHASSSLADLCTLKMEAIRPSETSVHTRCTRRQIPEDIFQQSLVLFPTKLNPMAHCQ